MIDLDELRRLSAAATPGPFTLKIDDIGDEEACRVPIEMHGANGQQIVAYEGGFVPNDGPWTSELLFANATLLAYLGTHRDAILRRLAELQAVADAAREHSKTAWAYAGALICGDERVKGKNTFADFEESTRKLDEALAKVSP